MLAAPTRDRLVELCIGIFLQLLDVMSGGIIRHAIADLFNLSVHQGLLPIRDHRFRLVFSEFQVERVGDVTQPPALLDCMVNEGVTELISHSASDLAPRSGGVDRATFVQSLITRFEQIGQRDGTARQAEGMAVRVRLSTGVAGNGHKIGSSGLTTSGHDGA
jgi:hypothetical protein